MILSQNLRNSSSKGLLGRSRKNTKVGDLVIENQRDSESLSEYILRWRNLSMKCEPQLQEEHAVDILLKNIKGPIAPYLRGFEITTFQMLLSKVSKLQDVFF